jgi:hypothetical protein
LLTILDRAGVNYTNPRTVCAPLYLYTIAVPGETALASWETLRVLAPETGYWPLLNAARVDSWQNIVNSRVIQPYGLVFPARRRRIEDAFGAGFALDVEAWFHPGQEGHEALFGREFSPEFIAERIIGEWPDDATVEPMVLSHHRAVAKGQVGARTELMLVSRAERLGSSGLAQLWRLERLPISARAFRDPPLLAREVWRGVCRDVPRYSGIDRLATSANA